MTTSRLIKISLFFFGCFIVAAGSFVFFWYRSGDLSSKVIKQMGKSFLTIEEANNLGFQSGMAADLGANFAQKIFGFERPQTFLALFLNNTELRPGGGFIGTYAVITLDKGNPTIVKVEGTEIIDNLAPKNFTSVPPQPIKDYLNLERWYFRDSNWSPDFTMAAAKSLDLYRKEGGVMAEDVDVVVAFTPTVVEELLKITGPVVVDGLEFNAENFTEKLEYEVEYGFADKGISYESRKKMLSELTKKIVALSAKNIFKSWNDYKKLVEDMLEQKQIIIFSSLWEYQRVFEAKNWAGKMSGVNSDYLLWADANLGSLKTDFSIERTLSYQIYKDSRGRYIAKAKMTYDHKGKFDWRTSRYRDYARVFVPLGSELVSVKGAENTEKAGGAGHPDIGIENGRTWFGSFISIEPGQTESLIFEYVLPVEVVERIEVDDYSLLVQKQIGTTNVRLTLGLDFGKPLSYAAPSESIDKLGDNRYDYSTILLTDLDFKVKTK